VINLNRRELRILIFRSLFKNWSTTDTNFYGT